MFDRVVPKKLREAPFILLVGQCLCLLVFAASDSFAQEQNPGPELKARFHQDFRAGDPNNPNLRPIRDGNFRWEAGGARVTMNADAGKIPTTGIAGNFQIKGDFEITAAYEILKADRPSEGYGVGVSLFVAIDEHAPNAVSLARRVGIKGNVLFLSDRMQPVDGKLSHVVRTRPSRTLNGKLRIQRVGSIARFFVADGDGAQFVPVYQDGKTKRIDTEFSAADIRYFQFGGDAGDSQSALDLRLLDLTVCAEALPGLVDAPAAKRAAPAWVMNGPAANADTAPVPSWLAIGAIGGTASVLVLGIALGGWLVLRRRRPAKTGEATEAPAKNAVVSRPAPTVSFACAGCGKKLRVKAAAAGKKVKCVQCGQAARVPRADAIEADESFS